MHYRIDYNLYGDQFRLEYMVLILLEIILFVLWLYLASRSIKVEIRSGRLYLRNKEIDVTRGIHRVKRQNENIITICFNYLYQLNIMVVNNRLTKWKNN